MKKTIICIVLTALSLLSLPTGSSGTPGDEMNVLLIDTHSAFPLLKNIVNVNSLPFSNIRFQYSSDSRESLNGNFNYSITSEISIVNSRQYAMYKLSPNSNGSSQSYIISWQLPMQSSLNGEAFTQIVDIARQSGNDNINSALFASPSITGNINAFSVSYSFTDGQDVLDGYSVTLGLPPSDTFRFWRTFSELMVINSFGLINYFVNKDANMVDWEYQPDREGFKRKITDGWCMDTNNFRTNTLYHIYAGIIYYQTGRSNGYGYFGSFLWAFAGSTMWEYIGEYREQVSTNDQIFTPMGGVIMGEALRQAGLYIERSMRPGIVRGFLCFIIDPMRIINRQMDRWIGDEFTFNVQFLSPAHSVAVDALHRTMD
jgi:hypothetical protein